MAESVIPFIEHDTFVPAKADVLPELRGIRKRAECLDGAEARSAYLAYIALLSQVYESFLRAGGNAGAASLPD